MPTLRFRHNYRSLMLTENEPAYFGVPVCLKDGSTRYLPWRGFIEKKTAQKLPGARPVKLDVGEYKIEEEWGAGDWIQIGENKAIQGCLVSGVVFAVVDEGIPRLILRSDGVGG